MFLNFITSRPFLVLTILALVIGIISGCGDDELSSTKTNSKSDFNGTWNLEYDVLVDECGLVPKESNSFNDTQTVTQNDTDVTVSSTSLSKTGYQGELRPQRSFETSFTQEGDLFGDGVRCELKEALAYNSLTLDGLEASSLYDLRLKCDDGFYCVSALRGVARR